MYGKSIKLRKERQPIKPGKLIIPRETIKPRRPRKPRKPIKPIKPIKARKPWKTDKNESEKNRKKNETWKNQPHLANYTRWW